MSTDDILAGLMHVLTDEDDVRLWRALLAVLVIDVDAVVASDPVEDDVLVELGSCSHWLRPHQTRWTAAGGFAWPAGYGDGKGFGRGGLPALDRSHTFRRDPATGAWAWPKGRPGRRPLVLRVAVPTRTTRRTSTRSATSRCCEGATSAASSVTRILFATKCPTSSKIDDRQGSTTGVNRRPA